MRAPSRTWWMNPPGLPPFWQCPWPFGAVGFLVAAIAFAWNGNAWAAVGFGMASVSMLCAYGMEVAFRMMSQNAHDLLDDIHSRAVNHTAKNPAIYTSPIPR